MSNKNYVFSCLLADKLLKVRSVPPDERTAVDWQANECRRTARVKQRRRPWTKLEAGPIVVQIRTSQELVPLVLVSDPKAANVAETAD